MIRDFCEISKATLNLEIGELKRLRDAGKLPHHVQDDTITPIDQLRMIGNFGAHMDKDVNVLLDVTEPEARHLIAVLEVLFDEWYVARAARNARLKVIGAIHDAKDSAKKG